MMNMITGGILGAIFSGVGYSYDGVNGWAVGMLSILTIILIDFVADVNQGESEK